MGFNDYKSITISKQGVSLDGQDLPFDTQLPTNVDYVQFHAGRDFLIEEPSFNEVPLDNYNYVFGLYEQALANAQEEVSGTELQIAEAKEYLASTDFYMTIDKYATLTEERQLELTTARAEARELINSLEE